MADYQLGNAILDLNGRIGEIGYLNLGYGKQLMVLKMLSEIEGLENNKQ